MLILVIQLLTKILKITVVMDVFCNKSNKTLMCKKENINSLKMGEEATIHRIAEIGHCSFLFIFHFFPSTDG